MSSVGKLCNGVTQKGKKCTQRTKNEFCRFHLSQKKGEASSSHEDDCMIIEEPDSMKPNSSTEQIIECCVCMDPIHKNEKKMKCECSADIHQECVIKSGKSLCPACQRIVKLTGVEKRRMERYHDKYKRETERENFRNFQNQFNSNVNQLPRFIAGDGDRLPRFIAGEGGFNFPVIYHQEGDIQYALVIV
jgi:hypothetical protein